MLKKTTYLIILIILMLNMFACAAHIHTVGEGPRTGVTQQQRQWYVLWGLIPINEVDTAQMAGNAVDYEIKTEMNFIDFVISYFTGIITVNSRSVTVTR